MPASATQQPVLCPSCHQKAQKVGPATLGALLKDEFATPFRTHYEPSRGSTGCQPETGSTGWRFCASPDCDTVYFSEEGDESFVRSDLKVPVGIKAAGGDRPLCYCFGHSVASIKEELVAMGKSTALADVRAKMKAPGCRCEIKNPSGSCCLGNLATGVEVARAELGLDDALCAKGAQNSQSNRGERIAKVGTLVFAIMASSCCWLPLLLLAIGVSGAGIASTLEAYRPVFMTITFCFLGAAFYFTYRPRKSAAGGYDCCEPPRSRISMMTMNKVLLWAVTGMAIAFLFFPGYVGAFLSGDDDNVVTGDMHRTIIKVKGTTCEGCSALVAKAIRTSPGVLAVEVSYENSEAIVGTATETEFPGHRILTSLRNAGYDGHILDGQPFASLESTKQKER